MNSVRESVKDQFRFTLGNFVSHNMNTLEIYCKKPELFRHKNQLINGIYDETISEYFDEKHEEFIHRIKKFYSENFIITEKEAFALACELIRSVNKDIDQINENGFLLMSKRSLLQNAQIITKNYLETCGLNEN